eukprot:7385025-Prymnesium_polylepis.5
MSAGMSRPNMSAVDRLAIRERGSDADPAARGNDSNTAARLEETGTHVPKRDSSKCLDPTPKRPTHRKDQDERSRATRWCHLEAIDQKPERRRHRREGGVEPQTLRIGSGCSLRVVTLGAEKLGEGPEPPCQPREYRRSHSEARLLGRGSSARLIRTVQEAPGCMNCPHSDAVAGAELIQLAKELL